MARAQIHIGTSGWHYAHWVGPFYPEGLPAEAFLGFYARHFATVEINATFYGLPKPKALAEWRAQVPEEFVFACKASRFITHMKKLKDPERSTPRLFEAVAALGASLGPILFQLPPRWRVNAGRLAAFLDALAKDHRYAFEFRDASWHTDEIYRLLARHDAAFCAFDLDGRLSPVELTAPFAYVRLHGPDGPYRGRYGDGPLADWARRFTDWSDSGVETFCYFDNDEAGYAAEDARRLIDVIGRDRAHAPPPEA